MQTNTSPRTPASNQPLPRPTEPGASGAPCVAEKARGDVQVVAAIVLRPGKADIAASADLSRSSQSLTHSARPPSSSHSRRPPLTADSIVEYLDWLLANATNMHSSALDAHLRGAELVVRMHMAAAQGKATAHTLVEDGLTESNGVNPVG